MTTKNRNTRHRAAPFGRRATAILLCLALTGSLFYGLSGAVFSDTSAAAAVTDGVTLRQADPSTMDTYLEMLNLQQDTRAAGRMWTDKSVFAYGQNVSQSITDNSGASFGDREFKNNVLRLTQQLDGVSGEETVGLNSDFLEVFSLLGSSSSVSEFPVSPLDLVITIDMSASMAQDTRYGIDSSQAKYTGHTSGNDAYKFPDSGNPMEERIANSRIQQTLNAVNATIDELMAQNPNNRVAVIGYGATAAVLMPLAHYQRIDSTNDGMITEEDTPYLSVGGMETLYHPGDLRCVDQGGNHYKWAWRNNRDACYTVVANAVYSTANTSGYQFDANGSTVEGKTDLDPDTTGTFHHTVSNNVRNTKVKALPGVGTQDQEALSTSAWNWSEIFNDFETYCGNNEKNTDDSQDLAEILQDTSNGRKADELQADHYIGYLTNTQGGIYLGLKQLAEASATFEVTLSDGESTTIPRIPACIIMSDGGANFALNDMSHPERFGINHEDSTTWPEELNNEWPGALGYDQGDHVGWILDTNGNPDGGGDALDYSHRLKPDETSEHSNTGDEWYRVYLPDDITSLYNDGMLAQSGQLTWIPAWYYAGVFYSNNDTALGTSGTVLETLMTASYMTAAVNKHYKGQWDQAQIEENRQLPLQTYTVGVDSEHVPQWGRMRLYPTQDPAQYPLENKTDWWDDTEKFGDESIDGSNKTAIYTGMLNTWATWRGGSDAEANIYQPRVKATLARLAENGYEDKNFGVTITNEDVIDNMHYTNGFFDVTSDVLGDIFKVILSRITSPLFTPVTGENDLGVNDSVTFMDPVGKYMEVKDVTHLLLFGELHEIAKAAVYDYAFNTAYIQQHQSDLKGLSDENSLADGWFKGDDPATAEYGGSDAQPNGGTAWQDGWVYRLSATTASQYVPSLADIKSDTATDAITKMRHTEYTFYRVQPGPDAGGEVTDDTLRVNPAYPTDSHESITGETPGAYRLTDLRVWVEDTGEYSDETVSGGGVQSDTTFDRALWVNVPRYMIPLRTVTLTETDSGKWTYESNMSDPKSRSHLSTFPLRLFYEIGIEEPLLTQDRTVDVADVSAEYITNNKVGTQVAAEARGLGIGNLEFFSNWYNPENRYGQYATSNVEYSYGDPATSFSPSGDNRYYLFENALPLYKAAYQYSKETQSWNKVVIDDGSNGGVDPRAFGGKIIDVELEAQGTNESIGDALTKKYPDLSPTEGDIVLLADDRLDDVNATTQPDPFPSEGYYFLPIDYFTLNSDKTAEAIRYCVVRRGSEFGSGYSASGIKNGAMLCWYDASGTYAQTYPYLSYSETGDETRGKKYIGYDNIYDETGHLKELNELQNDSDAQKKAKEIQESGTWVVAARPGGLRTGSLAQAVGNKTREYYVNGNTQSEGGTGLAYNDTEHEEAYKKERFPNKAEDNSFHIQYYNGNITRTANNYYLPTISVSSDVTENQSLAAIAGIRPIAAEEESGGIVVNTYLGNNGRLVVMDTDLLVTKLVEKPLSTDYEFPFQVFIDGRTGDYDGLVVKYIENVGWKRQLHTVDLLLDAKLFLLNTDGTKAMVDAKGEPVVAQGDGYIYPNRSDIPSYDPTSDNGPYYVFIGTNADTSNENAMRVYHNEEPHTANDVTDDCIRVNEDDIFREKDGNAVTFKAAKAWLFTQEQYDAFTAVGGSYETADGAPVGDESSYTTQLNGTLELLTLNSGDKDTIDIQIETPYSTQSSYWTKTVHFEPTEGSSVTLFDSKVPAGLLTQLNELHPDTNINGAYLAAHTCEFTLKHGYGLLFTGMPAETPYRATEQIEQSVAEKYAFLSVEHNEGMEEGLHTYTEDTNGKPVSEPEGGTSAQFSSSPDAGSAYSVFGGTGVEREAAHYTNAFEPDALQIAKELGTLSSDQLLTGQDKMRPFEYTVTFTLPENQEMSFPSGLGALPYWIGETQDIATAPRPTDRAAIAALAADHKSLGLLETLTPESVEPPFPYTFTLTADQTIVIYDLPIGTKYTVTEVSNAFYKAQDGTYEATGIIKKSTEEDQVVNAENNMVTFTNIKQAGSLTVEKKIENSPADTEREFHFTVTLTFPKPELTPQFSADDLVATKTSAGGTPDPFTLEWHYTTDDAGNAVYTAEFTLRHEEKLHITGIPLGAGYTVTEAKDSDYLLQRVEKSPATDGGEPLKPTDGAVSGTIPESAGSAPDSTVDVSLVFVNALKMPLPFAGGTGMWTSVIAGVLLMGAAVVIWLCRKKKA